MQYTGLIRGRRRPLLTSTVTYGLANELCKPCEGISKTKRSPWTSRMRPRSLTASLTSTVTYGLANELCKPCEGISKTKRSPWTSRSRSCYDWWCDSSDASEVANGLDDVRAYDIVTDGLPNDLYMYRHFIHYLTQCSERLCQTTVWQQSIWIKVRTLWQIPPQHQSTYLGGPESASIEIPPFRPHSIKFRKKFFLDKHFLSGTKKNPRYNLRTFFYVL